MRAHASWRTTIGLTLAGLVAVGAFVLLAPGLTGSGLRAHEGHDKGEGPKGAYLGVWLEGDSESPDGGARVLDVLKGSPAEKAGIEEGDVIVRLGGESIQGPMALTRKVRTSKPGEKLDVEVLRDGDRKKLTVELVERPERRGYRFEMPEMEDLEERMEELHERMPRVEKDVLKYRLPGGARAFVLRHGGQPRLGVELVRTTADLREFFGGNREAGVLVGRVLKESAAAKAGVKVGDLIVSVDGEKVREAHDLLAALMEKGAKAIELEVIRDRRPMRLKVDLPAREDDEEEPVGPRARRHLVPAPSDAPRPPRPPRPARMRVQAEAESSFAPLGALGPDVLAGVEQAVEAAEFAIAEVSEVVLPQALAEVERALEEAIESLTPEVLERVREALEEVPVAPEPDEGFEDERVTA